jgi:competence protein ComEC
MVVGAVCGLVWADASSNGAALPGWALSGWALIAAGAVAWVAWWCERHRLTVALLMASFVGAGAALAIDARDRALHTPLRALLDREFGGFAIDTLGPGVRHDPLPIRARLTEDASQGSGATTLRTSVTAVRIRGEWQKTRGDVSLSVSGSEARARADQWRAGRRIETWATFRRPARYLNEGVPDFERGLALYGTTLFGSVKSALLVDVVARGNGVEERAARIRRHVRSSTERWVGRHDAVSEAIVAAVLIGDRTGLPDDVRLRLQAAGTYHVIAISGGNIAIFAGLVLAILLVCGVTGRAAAVVTLVLLAAYAEVVTAGSSVWRATLMAGLYLGARALDHRSSPWHALALTASIIICLRPLDVRDAGFILTFGATAALLDIARRVASVTAVASGSERATGQLVGRASHDVARAHPATSHLVVSWLVASVAASLAVEIALMPVGATAFSRVTSAGLILNLVAVPLMGLVQVGGIAVSCFDGIDTIAQPAGWVAHAAASGLVESARLVDMAPWLATRVPAPPLFIVTTYYGGLAVALLTRGRWRGWGAGVLLVSALAIATGQPTGWWRVVGSAGALRITFFDVGQGDATLVRFPDGKTLLVDTGGLPFGSGGFDMGSRVVSPALWALGVRRLDTVLLTHGDPDHIGGARSIIDDLSPARVWEGVPVADHAPLQDVLREAREGGARVTRRHAGDEMVIGGTRVRVLHPPLPEWDRPRVRNDDSVVLEVVYGDVAVLLPGDVGAEIERSILSRLTPARHRILKVAHHGSQTSTSRELLEHWRPQIAVISAGRGNTFGHPAPEVIQQLDAIGTEIYRTDLDGRVVVETDGAAVGLRSFVERGR